MDRCFKECIFNLLKKVVYIKLTAVFLLFKGKNRNDKGML
jgi:hypothetical protein